MGAVSQGELPNYLNPKKCLSYCAKADAEPGSHLPNDVKECDKANEAKAHYHHHRLR